VNGASVQVPDGWLVAPEPPPGVALVAMAPEPPAEGEVRPNLVVTMVDRPAYDDVDAYLDAVLGELLLGHDRAELLELWTTDEPESVPPTLGQRLVVQHHAGDRAVWLVQQTPGSTTSSWWSR
jgi:hypothetical protein